MTYLCLNAPRIFKIGTYEHAECPFLLFPLKPGFNLIFADNFTGWWNHVIILKLEGGNKATLPIKKSKL